MEDNRVTATLHPTINRTIDPDRMAVDEVVADHAAVDDQEDQTQVQVNIPKKFWFRQFVIKNQLYTKMTTMFDRTNNISSPSPHHLLCFLLQ